MVGMRRIEEVLSIFELIDENYEGGLTVGETADMLVEKKLIDNRDDAVVLVDKLFVAGPRVIAGSLKQILTGGDQ